MHSTKNYIKSVRSFLNDSADWDQIEDERFYSSQENGEWVETSDNGNGGLDVSWAFGKNPTDDEIIEKFAQLTSKEVKLLIEQDFDQEMCVFVGTESDLRSEMASIAGKASVQAQAGKKDFSAMAKKRWAKK